MRQKLLAEFIGTFMLVAVVVGSGAMAQNLSKDLGVQLLINAVATILALGILIFIFSSISGSHFNPAVTLVEFVQRNISLKEAFGYLLAQVIGGIAGAMVANLMFKYSAYYPSTRIRDGWNLWLGELIATAGLLFLIAIMKRIRATRFASVVLACWIGSAYFFTSSTSFANPAVTIARSFSDTFSGIALESVPAFTLAQLLGAFCGTWLATQFSFTSKENENV